VSEAQPPDEPIPWKIVGVVMMAPFMTQMDSTIVNISLSSIRDSLNSTISTAQWVISGYLLALALMLPLNGWLVDRFGAKRLYLVCFSFFTAASALCAMAHTMAELIAARVFQGIAGGLLAPLAQLMMARVAGRQMARVIGYASVPVLMGPLLGPLLAGAILSHASWPWLFYVNLPVGILAVVLAAVILPHDRSLLVKRPFDFWGFVLLSPGLSLLLYGFDRASHHKGFEYLALGALLIALFLVWARRRGEKALIDIQLFRVRNFSVATTTQFLSNGIIYAGQFLLPLFLIAGVGLTPTQTGWLLSAAGFGLLFVYPTMGFLVERWGCRTVATTGVLINVVGTLPFVWMAYNHFSLPWALVGLLLRGLGQGATGIPSLTTAYASVPKHKLSYATTAVNIVQRLGGPILTTALSIVVSMTVPQVRAAANTQAFIWPFLTLNAFQLLVLASAIQLPGRASAVAKA
jgi:EmrB/QacA subfamily drug resistance transporter